jgi:hypothetical protein
MHMAVQKLVNITASADEALNGLDLSAQEGPKGIRLFIQGFG